MVCYTKSQRVKTEIEKLSRHRTVDSRRRRFYGLQSMVVANGVVHFMDYKQWRGTDHRRRFTKTHSIWNGHTGDLCEVEHVNCEAMAKEWTAKPVGGIRLVHVSSKNIILLIGIGTPKGNDRKIWKYDIESRTWSKAAVEFPIDCCQPSHVVLTADQKYIIFPDLYVLDIQDEMSYHFYRSSVKVPNGGTFMVSATGGGIHGDMLVIGWIRMLFATKSFAELPLPPLYLMQMMAKWVSCEQLHWIGRIKKRAAHYAINMHHILP